MKRGEKSKKKRRKKEEEENLGEKLRRGILIVGKSKGQRTPVIIPSSRLNGANHEAHVSSSSTIVSARKLAAALWELHHYRIPSAKMHRLRHVASPDPSPSSHGLPDSTSRLRKHVIASLMQHHRSNERNNHELQPLSPTSYGSSSMEVAAYNPAATPTSSLDFNGRIVDTNYNLKTSTELIKVLNRIWALEEQHSSNMSLVKALKKELDHARIRIKELSRERQNDKHEIIELRDQVSENRKIKDHDRKIGSVIQSIKDELEDERKLRKRSETLHRKLARELYEVKTNLSNTEKEIERERKSRELIEDLCDEFALGIRDYGQEIHQLKQKFENELGNKIVSDHRSILRISESWLNERMQKDFKMSSEIETFLQATKHGDVFTSKGNVVQKGTNIRRSSLESIPLNTAFSAPREVGDEEDSDGSDSLCFELNKPSSSSVKPHKENQIYEVSLNPHSDRNHSMVEKVKDDKLNSREGKSEIEEIDQEGVNGIHRRNVSEKNNIIDELIRSQYHHDSNHGESPKLWRGSASPIRQWTPKLPSQEIEIIPEESSSNKLPPNLRENTLKAKLLEARTRGQRSRSRLKGSKKS